MQLHMILPVCPIGEICVDVGGSWIASVLWTCSCARSSLQLLLSQLTACGRLSATRAAGATSGVTLSPRRGVCGAPPALSTVECACHSHAACVFVMHRNSGALTGVIVCDESKARRARVSKCRSVSCEYFCPQRFLKSFLTFFSYFI